MADKDSRDTAKSPVVVREATALYLSTSKKAKSDARFASPLLAEIHQTAQDLVASGVVKQQTMRELEALCLSPVRPMEAAEIRALREREGISQSVLARYLNVTSNAVSQWERGEKRPSGSSLKMLWLATTKGLDSIR